MPRVIWRFARAALIPRKFHAARTSYRHGNLVAVECDDSSCRPSSVLSLYAWVASHSWGLGWRHSQLARGLFPSRGVLNLGGARLAPCCLRSRFADGPHDP